MVVDPEKRGTRKDLIDFIDSDINLFALSVLFLVNTSEIAFKKHQKCELTKKLLTNICERIKSVEDKTVIFTLG